jgi:hypothetical protein
MIFATPLLSQAKANIDRKGLKMKAWDIIDGIFSVPEANKFIQYVRPYKDGFWKKHGIRHQT